MKNTGGCHVASEFAIIKNAINILLFNILQCFQPHILQLVQRLLEPLLYTKKSCLIIQAAQKVSIIKFYFTMNF